MDDDLFKEILNILKNMNMLDDDGNLIDKMDKIYEPHLIKEPCQHIKCMPEFDAEKAKKMTVAEVRKTYPRFFGTCPDCGYYGVIYASWEHYMSGDY